MGLFGRLGGIHCAAGCLIRKKSIRSASSGAALRFESDCLKSDAASKRRSKSLESSSGGIFMALFLGNRLVHIHENVRNHRQSHVRRLAKLLVRKSSRLAQAPLSVAFSKQSAKP